MRNIFIIFFLLLTDLFCKAQSAKPYAVWEDPITSDYYFVQLNSATGMKTNIQIIPGMTNFIAGDKTAVNTDSNYYYVAGLVGTIPTLFTLNTITGGTIYNPVFADNVVGLEYNCNDSLLYGLREFGLTYDLVTVDPVSGISTPIGNPIAISAYVGESFSLDLVKGLYSFIALVGGNFFLRSYDVTSGNLVYDNPFPDNLTGFHYNCSDSSLYALWEDNNQYMLRRVDLVTGMHSNAITLTGVTPGYVFESSAIDASGLYVYRGFDSNNMFSLITLDIALGITTSVINTSDNASGFNAGNCCYYDETVSISEIEKISDIKLFPIPAVEKLFITGKRPVQEGHIYTAYGREINCAIKLNGSSSEISLAGLSPGMYLIRMIFEDKEEVVKRFVKD